MLCCWLLLSSLFFGSCGEGIECCFFVDGEIGKYFVVDFDVGSFEV